MKQIWNTILGILASLPAAFFVTWLVAVIYYWITGNENAYWTYIIFFAIIFLGAKFGYEKDEPSSYSSSSLEESSSTNYLDDGPQWSNAEKSEIMGHIGYGKRINSETGIIEEKGQFGWSDTDRRIDPETGNFQKRGLIGWDDTGTRVDQDRGIVQKEGIFTYLDTNTRVNPESGIIQKEGLFSWVDTDKRIDPETGKSQHEGLFGWVDD